MDRDENLGGAGEAVPAFGPLLERVAGFYHKALLRGSRGLKYLAKLGLEDSHLLESSRIGQCDGSLMNVLPADDPRREDFLKMGLVAGKNGRMAERLLDHLVVPLTDADGGIMALWGINMRSGTAALVPEKACPLWNIPVARHYPELLLCGNVVDGLSLVRAGFPNVVALAGGDLQCGEIALLKSLGVQKLVVLAEQVTLNRLRPLCTGLEFAGVLIPRNQSLNATLIRDGERGLVSFIEASIKATPVEQPVKEGADDRVILAGDALTVAFGARSYTLCGIEKAPRRLRATVRTEFRGKLHVDTLDFYNARCRKTLAQDLCRLFSESASVVETDIARLIKVCENHEPRRSGQDADVPVILTPEERAEAEAFGRSGDLLEQIVRDYDECGLIGERSNKLISYLAAVSRKLDDPISILVLSSSGAGKSALQDATLTLCPPEDVVKTTSLSGKALFYKGRTSLKHKILAVEEGAGAEEASYAIRALVSAKELVIETAMKDFSTGRITTMENRVEGPTSVFITTTDPDIDAETRSRFIVLTVDESREQTRAILAFQRKRQTLEAVTNREPVEVILRRHRNFQRILKPLLVVNPYAGELSYQDDRLQSRRDHPKYLNLIRTVAFLHQMGREVKTAAGKDGQPVGYIEATRFDITVAERLMEESAGRNPDDLNGVSRALLAQIGRMVAEGMKALGEREPERVVTAAEVQFTRRDIREFTGWSHMRVKRYLQQLVEMEFIDTTTKRFGFSYRYVLKDLPAVSAGGGQGVVSRLKFRKALVINKKTPRVVKIEEKGRVWIAQRVVIIAA